MEKPPGDELSGVRRPIAPETRIQVFLEEYRALYGLLTFRLTVMDRRLPFAGGTLAGVLACTTAMPDETRLAFLLAMPVALLWLVFSTIQHARSKEDHLRRIDEIERQVNFLAGEELLVFQSRHPNKHSHPAGRTGRRAVLGVLSASFMMLVACITLAVGYSRVAGWTPVGLYSGYVFISGGFMISGVMRLGRYRYERPAARETPVFGVRGTAFDERPQETHPNSGL